MKSKSESEILVIIGLNISSARKEQDLSQKQLAFECDMPVRQIRRIEKGEHNTGVLYLYRISVVLEKDLSELVKLVENL